MSSGTIWQSIENSPFSSTIASSEWMFPMIEMVHVVAIVTVIGVIAIMDMRLLGLTSGNRSVAAMERDTLPVTWVAFALAVVTGLLLFVSKATSYMANPYFLSKMALMALAGVNMAVFHRVVAKGQDRWGLPGVSPSFGAKFAGTLSLLLWVTIPFCGRIVGFTLGVYY
jgi:hypothetical protein